MPQLSFFAMAPHASVAANEAQSFCRILGVAPWRYSKKLKEEQTGSDYPCHSKGSDQNF